MKTVRYYGIGDVRFEKTEEPVCRPGEVKIRVLYAGICGSDLHIYRKGMFIQNIPETMGHEFLGIVEELGDGVDKASLGDVVTANPMVPCGHCRSCRKGSFNTCESLGFIGEVRQGCFAEHLVMAQDTLIPILPAAKAGGPEELKPFVLAEPLAVAVHVMRRAKFKTEDKLAVFGAGPIGCLVIALAKQLCGVRSVTAVDLSPERLAYAGEAGADVCLTDGARLEDDYTITVDCAGSAATVALAAQHIDTDGRLCIVSIFENAAGVDCNDIVNKQLQVIGCNVYTREDLVTAVEILKNRQIRIDFLMTHEFPPEECRTAFSLLAGAEKRAQKVVYRFFAGAADSSCEAANSRWE